MDLEYFREFIELSRGLSISQTARDLHTSQSALSRHLQALETDFGASLVSRTKSDVQFTPEGEIVFDLAKTIIRAYDDVKCAFAQTAPGTPSLTISGHIDSPEDILLFLHAGELLKTIDKNPVVHFSAPDSRNETAYRDALLAGTVDIVFLWGNVLRFFKDDGFCHRISASRPWKAFVSADNPLSQKEYLTLQDFSDQTLMHFVGERYTSSWRMLSGFFAKHGIPIKERLVRCSSLYDYLCISLQDAILLFPPSRESLLNHDDNNNRIMLDIHCEEPFELNLYAVYCKNRDTRLIERYLEIVEREMS